MQSLSARDPRHGGELVLQLNGGTVPTIIFPDGWVLVEPSSASWSERWWNRALPPDVLF